MPWMIALALLSCTAEKRSQFKEKQDQMGLGTAATAYWDAVRWNNISGATGYIETPEQRLALGKQLSEPLVRITETTVLQVEVGDELDAARLPERREGIARIRVEAFDVRSRKVEVVTVEQHWVKKKPNSWFVDGEQSPVGTQRPW